jgi:hypothetical protein
MTASAVAGNGVALAVGGSVALALAVAVALGPTELDATDPPDSAVVHPAISAANTAASAVMRVSAGATADSVRPADDRRRGTERSWRPASGFVRAGSALHRIGHP